MKTIKIILRILIYLAIFALAGFCFLLYYFTKNDYQPLPVTNLSVENKSRIRPADSNALTFITWNIGYCGLNRDMDFFYDGGKKVRPDEITFQKNLNGVFGFLSDNDSVNFIFLQEVDSFAKRSYFTNQMKLFSKALADYSCSFATNYNVPFVPMPILSPMGQVISGIATFSGFLPYKCERYSYPLNYPWPMKLFLLDRCFMLQRYKLSSGNKELVLINLHNSAFDDADLLRQYETWMLRGFLLNEYEKGNYVIVGGDWNQNPPKYRKLTFGGGFKKNNSTPIISSDYLPENWNIAYDSTLPTNRDVHEGYVHGKTPTTIYDFFITSPNVIVEQVNVINCGFEFSDHQPVYMRVKLDTDPLSGCFSDVKNNVTILQDSIIKLNERIYPGKK